MQSLLSSHRPQATRKPCLNSHNRVHGRKLVSVEGGDCSKRSNFVRGAFKEPGRAGASKQEGASTLPPAILTESKTKAESPDAWLQAEKKTRSPSQVPFNHFFFGWETFPTKVHYRKNGYQLILTSQIWRT